LRLDGFFIKSLKHDQNKCQTVAIQFILTDYINQLLVNAVYEKLDDCTYSGRIPQCTGVVAFGTTLRECKDELHSTLEDWILLGFKLGHPLPVEAL